MLTDPVYEGKSMHGMIDRVRRGEFPKALACCMRTWEVFTLNAYSFLSQRLMTPLRPVMPWRASPGCH